MRRGSKPGVKRGPYNKKNKKAEKEEEIFIDLNADPEENNKPVPKIIKRKGLSRAEKKEISSKIISKVEQDMFSQATIIARGENKQRFKIICSPYDIETKGKVAEKFIYANPLEEKIDGAPYEFNMDNTFQAKRRVLLPVWDEKCPTCKSSCCFIGKFWKKGIYGGQDEYANFVCNICQYSLEVNQDTVFFLNKADEFSDDEEEEVKPKREPSVEF